MLRDFSMQSWLPLIGFIFVATCSPGPNNLMVLSSGANFGLARTWPHILGIAVGFPVLIVAVGWASVSSLTPTPSCTRS
jgi:threonine/homoserine/homoserine lactone efflux protein